MDQAVRQLSSICGFLEMDVITIFVDNVSCLGRTFIQFLLSLQVLVLI